MRFPQYNKKSRVAFALYFGLPILFICSAFIQVLIKGNNLVVSIIIPPIIILFILALLSVLIPTVTISEEGIDYRGLFSHHKRAWQEIGQVGITLNGGKVTKKSCLYIQTGSEKLDYETGSRGGLMVKGEYIDAEQRKRLIVVLQYRPDITTEIKKYWKGMINNLDLIEG